MVLEFLKELKHAHPSISTIFLEGSCFRLYKILVTVFPHARPFYSIIEGHWITEIDNNYYDINGRLSKKYIEDKIFELIEDEETLASAYIPTHEGQSVKYEKYIETI